mmetsp:Transcript_14482/g.20552  ORF Transcript_14482/g.20552 Transcript_14482/m.20552 type:complete len:86 (-) Transcript_14482:76-333(-)
MDSLGGTASPDARGAEVWAVTDRDRIWDAKRRLRIVCCIIFIMLRWNRTNYFLVKVAVYQVKTELQICSCHNVFNSWFIDCFQPK